MHRQVCALGAIFVVALAFGSVAASATDVPTAEAARPADETAVQRSAAEFEYGPILSRDPATRARIKHLYRQRAQLAEDAHVKLAELNARLHAESDPDFRFVTNREIGTVKRDLERENMKLGLEIARLNGDARRVADYERALDQLLHPEKYRPERIVDPAAEADRMRQLERN